MPSQLLKLYGGGFSPAQYSPALWLDASDQSTLFQERTGASATTLVSSDADPVGTWKDKSGNARHVTAPSDAARPTWKTGVQNGKTGVLFDSSDDEVRLGSALSLTDQTIFSVVKFASEVTAATASKKLLTVVSGDNSTLGFGTATVRLTNERLWWLRSKTGGFVYGSGQVSSNIVAGSYIHSWKYTNATPLTEVWQNGGTQSLSASSDGEANSSRPFTEYQTIGNAFGDHIFEIIIYSSALSASQRQQVERYLASKWGITLS